MVSNRNLLEFQGQKWITHLGDAKNHLAWCFVPKSQLAAESFSTWHWKRKHRKTKKKTPPMYPRLFGKNHEVLPWGVAEILKKQRSSKLLTLPSLNPTYLLKIHGWKMNFSFWGPAYLKGAMLNSKGVLHFFLREVTILELWNTTITSPSSQLLGGSFPSTT